MRNTLVKVGLSTAAAVLLMSSSAYAQATANASLNVTVNVAARARLTLGAAAITFADQDPGTVPTLTATALTVDVGARTSPAGNVALTVLATGPLASGSNTIAINNLAWTSTGTGFAATGTSPAAWIKEHHERVTHVHLKDRKKDNGPNMPFGQGDTPIKEILLMMKKEKFKFQATIEMEYPVPEGSTLLAEIGKCVKYCQEILS